jgi:hypothetical protein
MTIRLNYIEAAVLASGRTVPCKPCQAVAGGQRRFLRLGLRAREILGDGRVHTVSMNDGTKVISEPRLRMGLGMAPR